MLNITCKNSVKRYISWVFLLGSCRSCPQSHGNEALPKVSEALDCCSNTALWVDEQVSDSVVTFICHNSRNFRDTAFLFLTNTDQESLLESVYLEQPQQALSPSQGGDLGTKQCQAAQRASINDRTALWPAMGSRSGQPLCSRRDNISVTCCVPSPHLLLSPSFLGFPLFSLLWRKVIAHDGMEEKLPRWGSRKPRRGVSCHHQLLCPLTLLQPIALGDRNLAVMSIFQLHSWPDPPRGDTSRSYTRSRVSFSPAQTGSEFITCWVSLY